MSFAKMSFFAVYETTGVNKPKTMLYVGNRWCCRLLCLFIDIIPAVMSCVLKCLVFLIASMK